jgi:hypothetical protein
VTAPSWLLAATATLMLLIAASCASRLAIWRRRRRPTETDADSVHVLMGVAMAGMLEPRVSLVPGIAWQTVFAAAAAWFSWRAIRARGRRQPRAWLCTHPAPHAVECAAMLYMLLPARTAGHLPAMAMPGMSGPADVGTNPAISLVLALFMLGYVLWTTDKLAGLSRMRTAAPGRPGTGPSMAPPVPAISSSLTPRSLAPQPPRRVAGTPLAPRFAACYKIAMGIAMGYMLVMTL